MSGVVALIGRRVASFSRCENYRSVMLVKAPQPGQVLSRLLLSSYSGWTCF